METFSALLALCVGNSPVTGEFPHKCQWCRALMFSLICAWINNWVNNHEAGNLRCHRAHYDVIVMTTLHLDYTALYIPSSSSMHKTAEIISLLICIIMSFGCRKGRFKLPWANTHLLTSKLWKLEIKIDLRLSKIKSGWNLRSKLFQYKFDTPRCEKQLI